MTTLDYHELPKILNGMTADMCDRIEKVNKKLLEKAAFIARRLKADTDTDTWRKLLAERQHIEDVADLVDGITAIMKVFEDTVKNTQEDYWRGCIAGSESDTKIKLLQQTVAALEKREQQYQDLLKHGVIKSKARVHS